MGITCKKCPDGIRGKCCHFSALIEGHNVILDHRKCPLLDEETGLCSNYEHRLEIVPYCLHGDKMFRKGGLPKGCLYLKKNPELEPNPKISVFELIEKKQISPMGIFLYNTYNNMLLEKLEEHAIKP